MEKEAAITTTFNTAKNNNNHIENQNNGKKIKKRSAFQVLKVALFMLRRRGSNKKSKSVEAEIASKGLWKKLVGAMRPLHHQELPNQNYPPPSITGNPNMVMEKNSFHDNVITPPMLSPHIHHSDSPSSSSSSVSDSMSRYASAQDLQELDKNGESNNGDDDYFYGGDEFIDAKAEEFIAQFYEQMRLQQLDMMNRYKERKMKKLAMEEGNQ